MNVSFGAHKAIKLLGIGLAGRRLSFAQRLRSSAPYFRKVARHPVVAAPGQVFDLLAEVAPAQLGAALASRADQAHGKSRLKSQGHQRRLAEA